MKKFFKFTLGLFFPLYLLVDKFGFNAYLQKTYPNHADTVWWIIFGLIFAATIGNYIFTIYNPEKKYENALRKKNYFILAQFRKTIDTFESIGFKVRFNVMTKKTHYGYKFLYPDKDGKVKRSICPEIYECIFTVPSDYTIPLEFCLGAKQGTNANAIRTNNLVLYGIKGLTEEEVCKDLNLNHMQYEDVKMSTFLASIPIIDKDSKGKQKLIGVLTMESASDNMEKIGNNYDLSTETPQQQDYFKNLRGLTSITLIQMEEIYRLLNF